MSNLAISRRYAGALYAEAEAAGEVERVDADVARTTQALTDSRDLRTFFGSPVINISEKESVIAKLFEDQVSGLFLRFLLLLNEKGRGNMLAEVLDQYRALRNRQLGIVEADARSALPLSKEEAEALRDRLAEQTQADVRLDIEQDAALLGGLVVRIGDTVYDGSLKRKLAALKTQLEGGSFLRN